MKTVIIPIYLLDSGAQIMESARITEGETMNPVLDLNESAQELGRLALRVAANIDRYKRKKIRSLPELGELRNQLVGLTGLTNGGQDVSFSGEATAVNLVGAALSDVFNDQKNIGDLAKQLARLFGQHDPAPSDINTLTQLRKFCLALNQEIVRARYNSTLEAEDNSEFERERRFAG